MEKGEDISRTAPVFENDIFRLLAQYPLASDRVLWSRNGSLLAGKTTCAGNRLSFRVACDGNLLSFENTRAQRAGVVPWNVSWNAPHLCHWSYVCSGSPRQQHIADSHDLHLRGFYGETAPRSLLWRARGGPGCLVEWLHCVPEAGSGQL